MVGAAGAGPAQTTVTGSGTVSVWSLDVSATVDGNGSNPSGSIVGQVPPGTFVTNPTLTALHGDVSAGRVIRNGNTVDVVGRLPANEQWTVPGFGTIDAIGARIVDQGPGTPGPVDLVRVSANRTTTSTQICAGAGWPPGPAPALLTSGDFAVVSPFNDSNGDGIVESLQPSGTLSGSFLDTGSSPATTGAIVNAAGLSVSITDAPDPQGALVAVGSGSGFAEFEACGQPVNVAAGSTVVLTCASLIVHVVTGSADIVLEGGDTVVTVPQGGMVEISDGADGGSIIENIGTVPVTVTVDGASGSISPGETATTWDFQGFLQPVDNMPTKNVVKAGAAVPLKWRLLNALEEPVTDLSTASISVSNLECESALGSVPLEQAASVGSELQNLGDGYYQLNWKTAKSYAGTCRTVHLDIGHGVTHDSRFDFRK